MFSAKAQKAPISHTQQSFNVPHGVTPENLSTSLNRLKSRDMELSFCCWQYESIFIHFYTADSGNQDTGQNSELWSFNVTEIGTSLKSVYDFQSLQDVHGQHPVLHNLYARIGKRELFWLRTLTDDWSVIFAWYSSTVYVVCSSLSFFSFLFSFFLIVYFLSAALWRIKIYIYIYFTFNTNWNLYIPYSVL